MTSPDGVDLRLSTRRPPGPPRRRPGHLPGRPATPTTTRGPGWRSPAPSTTRRAGPRQGPGLVRQAVGQLPGHGRRLGLVQHAARRRQRPDAQPDPQSWRPDDHRLRFLRVARMARSATWPGSQFEVSTLGTWTSPHAASPIRAVGAAPSQAVLDLRITPVLVDQELDTRRSTSLAYWEAPRRSSASNGQPIAGQGYVELVGYNERQCQSAISGRTDGAC